jgi:hypothetical protein
MGHAVSGASVLECVTSVTQAGGAADYQLTFT